VNVNADEDDLDNRSGSAEYTDDGDDTEEIMRIFRPMQGKLGLSLPFCANFT
jgi:hypothetical protein